MVAVSYTQVNDRLMAQADPGAVFLHCLPRHTEEVADEVRESRCVCEIDTKSMCGSPGIRAGGCVCLIQRMRASVCLPDSYQKFVCGSELLPHRQPCLLMSLILLSPR